MKRTKQNFHKASDTTPPFVSGCRKFEGEDEGKRISINRLGN